MTLDEAIEYYINAATRRAVADEGIGMNAKWKETKFMTKKESEQIIADNRQLAEWLKELKEAKRLLKAAVEDFSYCSGIHGLCYYNIGCGVCADRNNTPCNDFQWRYADEVLKLLNDEK